MCHAILSRKWKLCVFYYRHSYECNKHNDAKWQYLCIDIHDIISPVTNISLNFYAIPQLHVRPEEFNCIWRHVRTTLYKVNGTLTIMWFLAIASAIARCNYLFKQNSVIVLCTCSTLNDDDILNGCREPVAFVRMPGKCCCVCGNNHSRDPHVPFHRFPSDHTKRGRWLEVPESDVKSHMSVSSRHFPDGDVSKPPNPILKVSITYKEARV